ncbi:hypothetical protein AXK11_08290 [Cephaloticoccus primus]|uniref:Uncharacterized protein n=1 Tax=Cephaloticoccus primus TaxID=1548207 RepID=A0A139SIS4_9BACT|nr:hypothetical protein AXK11_08290 [Cephaloticoccus primus]
MVITAPEPHVREHVSALLVEEGMSARDGGRKPTLQVPLQLIEPHELTKDQLQDRARAVEALLQWPKKYVIDPPLTIEEIISARDEGRR